jgi:hypothetical protein
VALVAGLFGVLPRLGGLTHDAAGLRPARPAFLAVAIVVPTAKGKAKESLRRRGLADHIPSINFCRTRCVPGVRNICDHGWGAHPNA